MQPMQPPPGKAGLFAMPPCGKELRKLVLRRPVCYAVNPSRATQRCYARAYSARCQPLPTRNHARRSIPHAIKAPPVEGLATIQCSAAQYGTTSTAPQRIHAARTNARLPRPCSTRRPVHAMPDDLCKFAQNRAVQALQIRPISTTCNALQELFAAISNGLAALRSTPGSAAQGIPDRPPGIDTLRLCAVGVEFS